MWYVMVFILGAALGGSGIGWLMWNKRKQIEARLEEVEKLVAMLTK